MWRHSATTSERGFRIITENKIEDIVRLQLSEVLDWLVKKKVWRHSEATNRQKIPLVCRKNYVMTFCDYIWAGVLKNYWKKIEDIVMLHLSEATSIRGLCFVSEKKCVKTFWGYIWARVWLNTYKNLKTFWEYNLERYLLISEKKYFEYILSLHLSEVSDFFWTILKTFWDYNWLVEKNVEKTFCDYVWARFLIKYWKRFGTIWGYNFVKFFLG